MLKTEQIFEFWIPLASILETLTHNLWLFVPNDDNFVVIRSNQSQIVFHIIANEGAT